MERTYEVSKLPYEAFQGSFVREPNDSTIRPLSSDSRRRVKVTPVTLKRLRTLQSAAIEKRAQSQLTVKPKSPRGRTKAHGIHDHSPPHHRRYFSEEQLGFGRRGMAIPTADVLDSESDVGQAFY